MREAPTGGKFAEENRRLETKILEEVAKVAAAPAPGSVTAEAARHVVEVAGGRTDSRIPADPRPTLKSLLVEQRFGKPTPPAPAPTAPPAEIAKDVLRAKLIEMNRQLAERHAEDQATKAVRDELAAELARLEGGSR